MTRVGWAAKHPGIYRDDSCERCGEILKPGSNRVMLELNSRTGQYVKPGNVKPECDSQGCFLFGKRCSEIALKEKGENQE